MIELGRLVQVYTKKKMPLSWIFNVIESRENSWLCSECRDLDTNHVFSFSASSEDKLQNQITDVFQ